MEWSASVYMGCYMKKKKIKIFRRKHLNNGANFVHVYTEIWDKVYLNLFNFSIHVPKIK